MSHTPPPSPQPDEHDRNEALYHLKAKLSRGASQAEGGELLDGDQVFDELSEMIANTADRK